MHAEHLEGFVEGSCAQGCDIFRTARRKQLVRTAKLHFARTVIESRVSSTDPGVWATKRPEEVQVLFSGMVIYRTIYPQPCSTFAGAYTKTKALHNLMNDRFSNRFTP